ncbi:MAG: ATP-binding cassette domain-containing protein [Lachnospiraceae bacterium]|nr:ATP-binding cassette domain-containing protein [Lachnospiraceae bacterium]
MNKEDNKDIIIGQNITFSYKDRIILDNQSFSFKKGEHIGIIGESGSGKSTFLKLLAGLLTPSSGTLSVDSESDPAKIMKKISMVMQDAMIMPLTIRENIALGKEIKKERMDEIIKATRLDLWTDSLPEGIDTYLGERADELSGGQAQRIAIARAIAKDADIILLDEPTSSLDKDTIKDVMEALETLTDGKSVIHVTHQTDLLKGYHRIVKIGGGRIYE